MDERVRMQNLGLSLVALGQGVPFFHAGEELLRSKSLDRNSYDSGDWFNRLDFSYRSNNWGVGLPPARENEAELAALRPLLADPALRPARGDIRRCVAHFREMLRIRQQLAAVPAAQRGGGDRDTSASTTPAPTSCPGCWPGACEDPEGRIDPAHALIVVL